MSRLVRQLQRREGASAVETLLALPAVLIMLALVIQVVVVLTNGVLVNHALSVAANEASARGGVDSVVLATFRQALPEGIRQQCVEKDTNCLTVSQVIAVPQQNGPPKEQLVPLDVARNISPGSEKTNAGAVINIAFTYRQAAPFLSGIGGARDGALSITRQMRVGSQSLQENN